MLNLVTLVLQFPALSQWQEPSKVLVWDPGPGLFSVPPPEIDRFYF